MFVRASARSVASVPMMGRTATTPQSPLRNVSRPSSSHLVLSGQLLRRPALFVVRGNVRLYSQLSNGQSFFGQHRPLIGGPGVMGRYSNLPYVAVLAPNSHTFMMDQTTTRTMVRGAAPRRPPHSPPPGPPRFDTSRWAQGAGLLGAAGVLLGKSKYVLGALKLTKLSSLGSMVLTIGTYSMFFGWPYAVGIVGLTLVHEAGHAFVMLQRGIPFSPMVFMPFMGAVIAMNKQPRDAWEDALVAFGGPVLGSIGAAGVAVGAHMTQSQLLYALADFGFMVNLFNLLPLGSMDGGRIAGACSRYAGVVGLGMGGMMAYSGVVHNPLFYIILLAGGYETFMRFYDPGRIPPHYYNISNAQRAALTAGYFGLVATLVIAMDANARSRKPPEVLMREREREKSWDYTY